MKICFVAPKIYPLLRGRGDIPVIGGAEVQQRYLGQGLRRIGYEVVYVTQDYGQPDGEVIDGMTVFKTFRPTAGIPGTRFFFPRVPKLWAALKRADADLYYVRGADTFLGVVAQFCRHYRRKLAFGGANDRDFIPHAVGVSRYYHKALFHHGLRRVDVIICQSRHQQSLLAQHHRLNGVALPNLFPDRHASPIQDPHHRPKPVVWVSVIKRTKRPQLALQTAKSLPQFQFIMVGGRALIDPDLYDRVEKEARAIANVRFLGFRPFEQTESLIGGAQVFLNTSEWEGFPNTFLQAWRAGVPTVSFHDPDRVIEEHGLGRAVKDLEEMRAAIVELYQGERRAACSQRARMYFDQHHRLESVIKKYDELFQTLAEGRPYSAGSPVFAH